MTLRAKRLIWIALVMALVSAPAVYVAKQDVHSRSAFAKQWAGGLNVEDLNAAATSIYQYPLVFRKAILAELSAEEASSLWRGHLRTYIASHDLSDEQAATIEEIAGLMTPQAFQSRLGESSSDLVRMQYLLDKTRGFLPVADVRFLFYRLGPEDDAPGVTKTPLTFKFVAWVRSVGTVSARAGCWGNDCDCSLTAPGSEDCGTGVACDEWRIPLLPCDEDLWWPSCGGGWLFACNGCCNTGV